ncbi:autotransporter assembly complex protein TamA [Psychromonas algicola]|uniref:autotransporter assembly complex protein TamA n=1 Tax=Psychromonas algicola TaxID=2555642 RepID=UPI001FBAB534|nr:autotransporter assembly complex family protein [Psychromonas sp. RZ5]
MNKLFKTLLCSLILTFIPLKANAEVSFDISGVGNDKALDNLNVFLKALSQPTDADNESYLIEVKETSKQSLIALGYYQARITTTVKGEPDNQVVQIKVNLGARTSISKLDLRLTGEALQDKNFQKLLVDFPIQEGQSLDHGVYESAKNSLISLAQHYGYFDAKYTKATVEVTQKNNQATVNLWFDSGIRYQFGEIIFDTHTPADQFVHSLRRFEAGDAYDTDKLNEFNQDLKETGYFNSITILPAIASTTGDHYKENKERKIPLHLITYMRPQDSFNTGLGYSTDEGVRGKFRWTRPWINHYGHSIETNFVASTYKQEATLTYQIPMEDPLYNYFSFQSGYKNLDQNDTNTEQYITSVNRHWRLDNDWLRTLYIRYDNESGIQGQETFGTELILPGISFSRTRSRGGVNVHWGDRQLVFFEFANESLLSSSSVIKAFGQNKIIRTYGNHQFINSAELGGIFAETIYDVPSSMRFFTGGDQSIRGYDYEEIAPTDADDFLVGGFYLATTSFEYRYAITQNWKMALFTDLGTATDDFSEPLSIGSGAGIVWTSPVGPIRLYVAKPFTETGDSFKLHLMIGPEL